VDECQFIGPGWRFPDSRTVEEIEGVKHDLMQLARINTLKSVLSEQRGTRNNSGTHNGRKEEGVV